ncbi:GNAT family N-acetyltransferase [Pseudalkalibacillus caeni]|uniref:GNAT family N-acetyltransferase n=1 Tax=Exobacillus caeni TaxID=2574798 RepID=A0A5R9F2S0_9BACL|nr:GNAT family N-acetyltransferase [Pseudalkalibacillus caeni]
MIREAIPDDARAFLKLLKKLDRETKFMLFEPDERKTTEVEQRKQLETFIGKDNKRVFVVENEEDIVGFLLANGGNCNRNKHACYLVCGILQKYTGQGIGTSLFEKMEEWAIKNGIKRLELTVMKHNRAALYLYGKAGFYVEGLKRNSLIVDGEFVDEFYMAKLL